MRWYWRRFLEEKSVDVFHIGFCDMFECDVVFAVVDLANVLMVGVVVVDHLAICRNAKDGYWRQQMRFVYMEVVR